jgi:hypothetical protein
MLASICGPQSVPAISLAKERVLMSIQFSESDQTLAETLRRTITAIQGETITVRELMELIGDRSLLFFCIILTIPFLLPVSIPGVSTVFGLVIILIGASITLNRTLWMPNRLQRHQLATAQLVPMLEKGAEFFQKLDRWVGVRLGRLTHGPAATRINGFSLLTAGVLLLFPLSFIPFSNTLPALAVLFLSVGMLQKDGYSVLVGYAALVATVVYFAALAAAVIIGGQTLLF